MTCRSCVAKLKKQSKKNKCAYNASNEAVFAAIFVFLESCATVTDVGDSFYFILAKSMFGGIPCGNLANILNLSYVIFLSLYLKALSPEAVTEIVTIK